MRYLAISDIHGHYQKFLELLEKVKYNPHSDKLILLGDYIDRGTQSEKVMNKVMKLVKEDGAIALRGNHEQMFLLTCLYPQQQEYHEDWIANGGLQTIGSYAGLDFFEEGFKWEEYEKAHDFILKHRSEHIEFIKNMPFYYETPLHLFVHAGINPFYKDFKSQPHSEFLWIREHFYKNRLEIDKVVVFGHTPTPFLHKQEPNNHEIWFDQKYGDKIGIDGACFHPEGQLNCLIYDTEDGSYDTVSIKRRN